MDGAIVYNIGVEIGHTPFVGIARIGRFLYISRNGLTISDDRTGTQNRPNRNRHALMVAMDASENHLFLKILIIPCLMV